MSGYGQFCPVAKAMELLDERWTTLDGSVAVSGPVDVRRAVPSWIGQATLTAVPRAA